MGFHRAELQRSARRVHPLQLLHADGSAAQVGVVSGELVITEKSNIVEVAHLRSGVVSGSVVPVDLPAGSDTPLGPARMPIRHPKWPGPARALLACAVPRLPQMASMPNRLFVASVLAIALAPSTTRAVFDAAGNPLVRRYAEGETLRYLMKGVNHGRHYEAVASGVVRRDANGRFLEEYTWSALVVNGGAVQLSPTSASFRQRVSLDPGDVPSVPNLATVDRGLIGPVLDFLNFYVDLQLASKQSNLISPGSHVLVPRAAPNSWADGTILLIAEDAIDFDITLTSVDTAAQVAVVTVRHVPPSDPRIQLPASWMRPPIADTSNNWVQVTKSADGYVASVGKEIIDVRIRVSLVDGRILSATMDNPVQVLEKTCKDAVLMDCGEPSRYEIRREIELTEQR